MSIRPKLDDYCSIVCFKAIIVGIEDILGTDGAASLLLAAGRKRGTDVATAMGYKGKNLNPQELATALNSAVGEAGTRLCIIESATEDGAGGLLIKTSETVCTAGEPADSKRTCTYTLGAVVGFAEAATGRPYRGKHVANVLNGSPTDDFSLTPV